MRLFCKDLLSLPPFTFTGAHDQRQIFVDGVKYLLITLFENGLFTMTRTQAIDLWMCGGGAGGMYYSMPNSAGSGGGGGFFYQQLGLLLTPLNAYNIVIGEGGVPGSEAASDYPNRGGTTYFGTLVAEGGYGRVGGSGGGQGGSIVHPATTAPGGPSTIPFHDNVNFHPHCPGGGGRFYAEGGYYYRSGGNGGSNGGYGASWTYSAEDSMTSGLGGNYGGGNGEDGTKSTNAYSFGAGGGGGSSPTSAGRGYKGVVYIRICA